MNKILLLTLLIFNITFSQTTNIPDSNFEQRLIVLGLDDVLDGTVLTSNISSITTLNLNEQGISDLTGIEDFNSLTELRCKTNNLTTLDLSQNINLEKLYCSSNNISSLVITQNINLNILECDNNNLSTLNLTQNTNLDKLRCHDNNISILDLSQNIALTGVWFYRNNIYELDLSNNVNLTMIQGFENDLHKLSIENIPTVGLGVSLNNNPNLQCIIINSANQTDTYWESLPSGCIYSTDCGYTLSIENINLNDNTIIIYPNPTAGILNIKTKEYFISKIFIYNSNGQLINQTKEQSIDFSNYSNGIYYLRVILSKNKSIIKKLIVQDDL